MGEAGGSIWSENDARSLWHWDGHHDYIDGLCHKSYSAAPITLIKWGYIRVRAGSHCSYRYEYTQGANRICAWHFAFGLGGRDDLRAVIGRAAGRLLRLQYDFLLYGIKYFYGYADRYFFRQGRIREEGKGGEDRFRTGFQNNSEKEANRTFIWLGLSGQNSDGRYSAAYSAICSAAGSRAGKFGSARRADDGRHGHSEYDCCSAAGQAW
ncbi:hypothetical protein D3C78_1404520 [compost metagenome]